MAHIPCTATEEAGMLSLSSIAVSSPLKDVSSSLVLAKIANNSNNSHVVHSALQQAQLPQQTHQQQLVSILCPTMDAIIPSSQDGSNHARSSKSSIGGFYKDGVMDLCLPQPHISPGSMCGSPGQCRVGEELLPVEDLSMWSGALPAEHDGFAPLSGLHSRGRVRVCSSNHNAAHHHRKTSARSVPRTVVCDSDASQRSLSINGGARTSSYYRMEDDNPLTTAHSRTQTGQNISVVGSGGNNSSSSSTTSGVGVSAGVGVGVGSALADATSVGRSFSIPQFMSISRLEVELHRHAENEDFGTDSGSVMWSSFFPHSYSRGDAEQQQQQQHHHHQGHLHSSPTSPHAPPPLGRTVLPTWRCTNANNHRPPRQAPTKRRLTVELNHAREEMKELGLVQFDPTCSTQDVLHRQPGSPAEALSRPLSISPGRSFSDVLLQPVPDNISQGTFLQHSVLSSFA